MKRFGLLLLTLLIISSIIAGCGGGGLSPSSDSGYMVISVSYPQDKVSTDNTAVAYYLIDVLRASNTAERVVPTTRIDYPETTAPIFEIPVGTMLFTVQGFNSDNVLIYYGEAERAVVAGKNTPVTVIVTPLFSPTPTASPTASPTPAAWQWDDMPAVNLNAVYGAGADLVFFAGDEGIIYKYDSGTISQMESGTTENLTGIWGKDSSDICAVGENGTIVHYDGSSWTKVRTAKQSQPDLKAVWYDSDNNQYIAVGAGGNVLYSGDGITWNLIIPSNDTTYQWNDVRNRNGTIMIVGEDATVADTSAPITSSSTFSLFTPFSPGYKLKGITVQGVDAFVCGTNTSNQGFSREYDNSLGWQTEAPLTSTSITNDIGSSLTNLVTAGVSFFSSTGVVYKWDTGWTFSSVSEVSSSSYNGVWVNPGSNRTYICGNEGAIASSNDASSGTWAAHLGYNTINAVDYNGTSLYATGNNRKDSKVLVMKQTYATKGTWTTIDPGNAVGITEFSDVHSFSDTETYFCGGSSAGYIYSYDGASTWVRVYKSPAAAYGATFKHFWAPGDGTLYASGYSDNSGSNPIGMIHRYSGGSWSTFSNTIAGGFQLANIYGMWGSGSTLYCITNGSTSPNPAKVYRYNSGTTQWEEFYAAPATSAESYYFYDFWGTSATDFYIIGYKYTATSSEACILHYKDGTVTNETPSALISSGASLSRIKGNSASDIFVVGSGGNIWHFDGSTWSKMSNPGSTNLMDVLPLGTQDVWAVGRNSSILHYTK